jgi:predicted dehydrogenase
MKKEKVKWGILSTARIAVEKVIPAMQSAPNLEISAICSRNMESAENAASKLGISKFYGSYTELLNDPDIDAVYIPLPNHLHFEWTKKAIQNGKHVLCEKPLALNTLQIKELIQLRDQYQVKVGEAFMVRTHPQWLRVLELVRRGALGQLRSIQGFFSYYKKDPDNIRNILEYGGGAIWDIGCYPVHTSRYVFGVEPTRVVSLIDRDPTMKIDRQSSVIIEFPEGHCTFTVSTQLVPHQKMMFFGEEKKLEIDIPFNAPIDRETKIFIDDGDLFHSNLETEVFNICDQYGIQGEKFSDAVLKDGDVPVSLEDSSYNTSVIEAIFESEKIAGWANVKSLR